jgi:hypothetical protein
VVCKFFVPAPPIKRGFSCASTVYNIPGNFKKRRTQRLTMGPLTMEIANIIPTNPLK